MRRACAFKTLPGIRSVCLVFSVLRTIAFLDELKQINSIAVAAVVVAAAVAVAVAVVVVAAR